MLKVLVFKKAINKNIQKLSYISKRIEAMIVAINRPMIVRIF